ncbi:hypothetical protein DRF65_16425 [Chryseobacterium pennae]|uniref:Lipoprotein n=1 Tax=Chryseobacterium pennae TaxID=2258962 RepID=A0A3D9C744_9FLAO|nr:hypothetical protein [Chryseobacterium pennae]REC61301.1 hypothetical protein DRF65_16425 [Chryseobacterium pennae]
MKNYFFVLSFILIGCGKPQSRDPKKIIKAKNATIDSLQKEYNDCRGQAQIMADVMEAERKEELRKK